MASRVLYAFHRPIKFPFVAKMLVKIPEKNSSKPTLSQKNDAIDMLLFVLKVV
jgi:hypothetical protein